VVSTTSYFQKTRTNIFKLSQRKLQNFALHLLLSAENGLKKRRSGEGEARSPFQRGKWLFGETIAYSREGTDTGVGSA
jgi:hypothetical protein